MKKIFAKIHLWLSLPLGIVLTVVCLSGAVLVFEGEITRALHPELYRVAAPADARPLRPSQLAGRIGGQMPDSLHLVSLQLSARSDEPCMAAFRETGRRQLSVDPYTGNVNGWAESPAFFGTVRKLHRWLLDPPPSKGEKSVGKAIVGVSTLALVLILVSGLILWIPRSHKALRNRLKVSCTYGRRRFWHDCHVSLGFYATLLLLVMALTGLRGRSAGTARRPMRFSAELRKPLWRKRPTHERPIRAAIRAAKEAANGTPAGSTADRRPKPKRPRSITPYGTKCWSSLRRIALPTKPSC